MNQGLTSFRETKAPGWKKILIVGGGALLHSFIKEKLIDEIILTVAPAVIGRGIPLFKEGDYEPEQIFKKHLTQ
ncbi:dihydrofolate reductase family protein [Bacillus sp. CMF12]|nr:dihydrofolate reductase family protein [Bacillus sp. CMF12]